MTGTGPPRTRWVRAGEWLFRHRGGMPVPLILAAIWLTGGLGWFTGGGLILVAVGCGVRLWSVSHIGPASRTRDDSVQKLTYTGPYELSRNPIYLGNLLIFAGVGLMTEWPVMVAVLLVPMLIHYSLIVCWEEWNLERRLGEAYRSYINRVPRWFGPSAPVHAAAHKLPPQERWAHALRSELSTLIAVVLVTAAMLTRGGLAG